MNFSEMAGKACVCSCSGNRISPHLAERRKFSSQANSSTRIQTRKPRLFPPDTLSTRINAIGGVLVPRKLRLAPKCFNYLALFLKNFKLKTNNWRWAMLSSAYWEKHWFCAWKGTVPLFLASKWLPTITKTFSFCVMKSWSDSLGQLAQELPGTDTRQVLRLLTMCPWRTRRVPRQSGSLMAAVSGRGPGAHAGCTAVTRKPLRLCRNCCGLCLMWFTLKISQQW